MTDLTKIYDLLVIGGGNAALSAAITARLAGCSVLLLEAAPKQFRGGNSRHTRNARVMHEAPTATLTEAYREDEYWDDLSAHHRRQYRREAGTPDHTQFCAHSGLDGAMRRAVPALAYRHTQFVAHQCFLTSAAARR